MIILEVKKIISKYLDIFSSLDKAEAIIKKNKADGVIYPHTKFYIDFGQAISSVSLEIEVLKGNASKAVKTRVLQKVCQ